VTDVTVRFRYRAARSDGGTVTGVLDAASVAEAVNALVDRGLHPLHVVVSDPDAGRRRPAPRRDLAVLFRSLAALTSAGVPLERALGASEPLVRGSLREAVADARQALREGRTLVQGLERAGGLVPAVVLGMLRAGEHGGRLAEALEATAAHLEHEAELVSRVRSALAYPILVALTGVVSVAVIGTVVIPRFAELLADTGRALPLTTRLLLGASAFATRYGLHVIGACVAFTSLGAVWASRPAGRRQLDRALLALPLVGTVRHQLSTARVGRALAAMLATGMPLLVALDAARHASGDGAVAERLAASRDLVAQGQPLARSLERTGAVTPSALQLVGVGESSGQLAVMLARAGDLSAREAERGLRTVVGLLEPALILLFGALVAFVAAALLQAVYGLRPGGV
jgi:type II secretory pathway component PulF